MDKIKNQKPKTKNQNEAGEEKVLGKSLFTNNVIKLLKKPIVTEKSSRLSKDNNEYVFKVDINANKGNIKKIIEQLYNIKVEGVNTIIRKGKQVRRGKVLGKRKDAKIAIVKIKDGQNLNIFK